MAIDLNSIWRKINAKKASGGYVPQGFTEDVLKANIAAEIQRADRERALTMDQQRMDEAKRQFEISKAENTRQFDSAQAERDRLAKDAAAARLNEFNTNTGLTKEQLAQREKEFATTSNLTADQVSAAKTQGLTSSLVQLPMAYIAGKSLYKDLLGKSGTEVPPTTANPLVSNKYAPKIQGTGGEPFATDAPLAPDVMPVETAPAADIGTESAGAWNTNPTVDYAPVGTETGLQSTVDYGLDTSTPAAEIGTESAGAWNAGGATGSSIAGNAMPYVAAARVGMPILGNALQKISPGEPDSSNAFQQAATITKDDYYRPIEAVSANLGAEMPEPVETIVNPAGRAMATVICTELHRQGLLDGAVWENDGKYRGMVSSEVYEGYRIIADPVVKFMQRSKLFTAIISPFAIRTAREMAHRVNRDIEGSLLGCLILGVFQPVCGWLGGRRGNVLNPVIP